MTELLEIKDLIGQRAAAFEEFKKANEENLKKRDGLLDEKLNRLNDFFDATKGRLDEIETAVSRSAKGDGSKSVTPQDAEYKKAFEAYARKGQTALIDGFDKKALSVGSDPDGGYTVTPAMSSNIIKVVYETSPVRQVAAVETISSDALEILEDRGEVGAAWVSEMGTRSETSTAQLGKKTISVHEVYAYPFTTQKLLDDSSINIEEWLSNKAAERFARIENTGFVNGNGVGQPRGFLTYASGTGWGQIERVGSGSSGVVTADGLISLFYALKPDYAANASWMANRSVVRAVRLLKESTTNQYIWQPGLQAGQPDLLLGRPVFMANDMPAAGAGSLSVAVGDFRRGYQIVDRAGVRVVRDNVTAPGWVKFNIFKRVGGDVINFEAIKLQVLS